MIHILGSGAAAAAGAVSAYQQATGEPAPLDVRHIWWGAGVILVIIVCCAVLAILDVGGKK